jgi:hypothetical protein
LEVTPTRIAQIIGADGVRRLARLDHRTDEEQEALLDQAEAVHDLTGPEPVSEIGGVVHRRGRPCHETPSPRQKWREEIAERKRQREKPPKEGGKPNARSRRSK